MKILRIHFLVLYDKKHVPKNVTHGIEITEFSPNALLLPMNFQKLFPTIRGDLRSKWSLEVPSRVTVYWS